MNRLISYLLSAMLLLTSCQDDSYKGAPENLYGYGSQSIPVVVALGDPSGGIAKGAGAIDNMEQWDGKYIYVYAFNRKDMNSFSSYSYARRDKCLVDGSVENRNSKAGKKARLAADDSYAKWELEEPDMIYPSGDKSKTSFDFFAYYLDNIEPSYSAYKRTDNSVSIDIEIDGSQDIMSSKAELSDGQLRPFTEKDRVSVIENAFSFYTAQRNIAPTFMFKHHLVRLEFEILSCMISERPKRVVVHSLAVKSKFKADFTVADKDGSRLGLAFSDEKKSMPLREKDGTEMPDDKYFVTSAPDEESLQYRMELDGNLLVAPDEEYEVVLIMTEEYENGVVVVERHTAPLTITYPNGFQAGNQYKVKLKIQGVNKVLVYVDIEPWGYGGKIGVDLENDKPDLSNLLNT